MRNYNTNQRRMLNDYLSRHADECISTADIISAMAEIGISGSAVYRNLSELENVINAQARKGYRLHTISTASGGSSGLIGGDRIQATLVFEKL